MINIKLEGPPIYLLFDCLKKKATCRGFSKLIVKRCVMQVETDYWRSLKILVDERDTERQKAVPDTS